MPLPISESQARAATRWLVSNFREPLERAVAGTPFTIELLCGIGCQETATLWLPFVAQGIKARDILARAIGDASGDYPNTSRNAFPRDTVAFRAAYGDAFTEMLIAEANATRALRGWGPKQWVYKGYGLFQYDLQHIQMDEAFFRERHWYEFEACLAKVMKELANKLQRTGELWAAVKAYNGSGARAEEYKNNVRTFTDIARDEIGRMLAAPLAVVADAPAAPRGLSRELKRTKGTARRGAKRALAGPPSRPVISQADLRERLASLRIDRQVHPVVVVGIRGFYRDRMGAPGVNDRGIYDDALLIDTPDSFASFNGNTDPSRVQIGHGTGAEKGMAALNAGLWYVHKFDLHKGEYLALCQRLGQVTVTRDGTPPYPDTGMFGINIHKGGYNTTSSLGCQTVHPDQWAAFIEMAVSQAKRWHGARWDQVVIPYALFGA